MKQKRKNQHTARTLLLTLLLLCIGTGILWRELPMRQSRTALLERLKDSGGDVLDDLDWVTVDLLPVNEYSRPGIALSQVNGVVVHYTGNPGTTAEENRSYFGNLAETGETYASSQFIIGIDGTVIQCVPISEVAYCSNSRNNDTVSIECCHPNEDGVFTDETYRSLVHLTKYLVKTFGLEYDEVIRHYDVTGKLCPYDYATNEDAWLAFKEDVF